jgi:hypothetical protein
MTFARCSNAIGCPLDALNESRRFALAFMRRLMRLADGLQPVAFARVGRKFSARMETPIDRTAV